MVGQNQPVGGNERSRTADVKTHARLHQMLRPFLIGLEAMYFFQVLDRQAVE